MRRWKVVMVAIQPGRNAKQKTTSITLDTVVGAKHKKEAIEIARPQLEGRLGLGMLPYRVYAGELK